MLSSVKTLKWIVMALLLLPGAAGAADLDAILGRIAELDRVGVVFDDTDPGGSVPVRRSDGKYHMCCIDLLNVAYRAAGYDLRSAGRQVSNLVRVIRRDPRFQFYPGPNVNPWLANWKPKEPFRVGDMIFVHYDDNHDRHSGIVTGVDPKTGLPSYITQVSIYSDNLGLHRSTFDGFFSLRCRQLTGWARPKAWNGAPISPTERALMVAAPPSPYKIWKTCKPFEGESAKIMLAALAKVKAARLQGERPRPVWVFPHPKRDSSPKAED